MCCPGQRRGSHVVVPFSSASTNSATCSIQLQHDHSLPTWIPHKGFRSLSITSLSLVRLLQFGVGNFEIPTFWFWPQTRCSSSEIRPDNGPLRGLVVGRYRISVALTPTMRAPLGMVPLACGGDRSLVNRYDSRFVRIISSVSSFPGYRLNHLRRNAAFGILACRTCSA